MRRAGRWIMLAGLLVVLAGGIIFVWPIKANGVTGTALLPRYHDFAWATFQPLHRHPTLAELRRAGVRLPQDVVGHRRHVAETVLGIGAVVLVVGSVATLASRRQRAMIEG